MTRVVPDAAFSSHRELDPAFASALDDAAEAGVRVLASSCRVSRRGGSLGHPLPLVRRRPGRSRVR